MKPDALHCESRRAAGMGMWRYSMAAVIIVAALIDVVWWVPAHRRVEHADEDGLRAEDRISATTPRCRRAAIQEQIQAARAKIDRLKAELLTID